MIPFNYHHLYYFYTIARHESVSRAAKELHLSQPALSYQLKKLEDYLDVKLFERKERKLVLTSEGHLALSYAKQIFELGKEFTDSLSDRSQKGRIKIQIGVLNSIPKNTVNSLIKLILKMEPTAHIQLHEDTFARMIMNLKDHLLDLILADMPFQASFEEGIQSHPAAKTPIVFCALPKFAKKYKKIPRDLENAPMIFPTADSRAFHSVREYLASNGVTPRIVAEVQDIELARLMALEGLGIVPLNAKMPLGTGKKKLTVLDPPSKHPLHDSLYIISKQRKNPHPLLAQIIQKFS